MNSSEKNGEWLPFFPVRSEIDLKEMKRERERSRSKDDGRKGKEWAVHKSALNLLFKCLSMIPSSTLDAHVSIFQSTVPVLNFDSETCIHTNQTYQTYQVTTQTENSLLELSKLNSRIVWIEREILSLPSFLHHLFPCSPSSSPFNWPPFFILFSYDYIFHWNTVVLRGIKVTRNGCGRQRDWNVVSSSSTRQMIEFNDWIPARARKAGEKSYWTRTVLYFFITLFLSSLIVLLDYLNNRIENWGRENWILECFFFFHFNPSRLCSLMFRLFFPLLFLLPLSIH